MITVVQEETGWLATCSNCAWKFRQREHVPTMHKCKVTGETIVYKPPGWDQRDKTQPVEQLPAPPKPLGQTVEEVLESYGITQDWWKGFKERMGLPPNCGCQKRKEWLDAVSADHPEIATLGAKLIGALKKR